MRIQREEGQYAQHKYTQSTNIGAFRVEKQTEVGVAGAEALGHMGANGTGGVDLGGGNVGFNPAAMMAGMAVGGAVGQNIAGTMNGMMVGTGVPSAPSAVPPPFPKVSYHIAVNEQAMGPFDLATITQMAIAGTFSKDSLVWKQGMTEWVKAETVQELQTAFLSSMPPVPPID